MEIAHADMIETEALAEQAAARHYLYQLLARAFAEEPDDALREALSSPLTAQAWRCLVEAGAVEKCGELDSDLRRSDLAAALSRPEYTRLFLGPGVLPVPPWESAHTAGSRGLFSRDTLLVRKFYASFGYRVQGYPRVSEDFLATELYFVAALCREELHALSEGDDAAVTRARGARQRFLREHVGRWIGTFSVRLSAQEPSSAYAVLAQVASILVQGDGSRAENALQ